MVGTSHAAAITITGYDIDNAVLSGHGSWAHSYDGSITPGVSFSNNGLSGTVAEYSGQGSGTLTDGITNSDANATQLFVNPAASDGTAITPEITLYLDGVYTLDKLNIFGGNVFSNSIPGSITGLTISVVTSESHVFSQSFSTVAFGPTSAFGKQYNDSVTLTGSTLDGLEATAVVLSAFQGSTSNWFSIAEIALEGTEVITPPPVPEPASWALMIGGLVIAGSAIRRQQRMAQHPA